MNGAEQPHLDGLPAMISPEALCEEGRSDRTKPKKPPAGGDDLSNYALEDLRLKW